MQFVIPEGPEEGPRLVERNAPMFLDDQVVGLSEEAPRFEIAVPHPIYTVTADAFVRGELLASAQPTAWQYVITVDDEPFGVAEVAWNEKRRFASYASMSPRQSAEQIIDAIARAERLPQVQDREYELRMLRAPGLYLFAVWLAATKRLGQDDNLLLPIEPVPVVLGRTRIFTEKSLTASMQTLAKTRMETSDVSDGGTITFSAPRKQGR
jgi:hypothetical protein